MTKAVVLLVPDESADEIGRLIASTLSLNGYGHNTPGVIDWPVATPEQAERDKTCPHGLHFNGYYCDDCAAGGT